ncbi:uncharacterized protein LOC105174845 isoform X2 [Sesamum indicum]|uniref:Uncharacterized protein LOC105174845 isoform X2 n=1 Tax=Sesamum indicum TaxID=4182 RepID=A0A6I9UBY4_SESIN|nr:uncharacterized protein LOC105174845 isoform X2 [Sesamum indicum]
MKTNVKSLPPSIKLLQILNSLICSLFQQACFRVALIHSQIISWWTFEASWNNMVQTLEAIRGGGGSVKVGTTGTISALMSREIESTRSESKTPSLCASVPVAAGDVTPRKLKPRTSMDEASSSGTSNVKNDKGPETVKKAKHYSGGTHQIPMLAADNISIEGTPIRQKPVKKGPGVVEIVDIKCGNPDKTWVNPITNRLKKLGFSKLSDSIG